MTGKKFDPDKHKRVLTALLLEIVKVVGEKIAFKGGTAAMLFYNLPRLSLDLDFDVLHKLNDEDKARLQAVIEKHGQIKEQQLKRFTQFYLIDYESNCPNIKIELNQRVWQHNSYKTVWLFGLPVRIADEATMLTNKLVALTDRRSLVARDVFDIYYFLKSNWPISQELVKERTDLSVTEYLTRAIKFLEEEISNKNILSGIGELLDEQQKDWARANLRQETIFLLKARLKSKA